MNLALPKCPECERLHGIYHDAAMSYMRLYDGSRRDIEETDRKGNQLKTQMQGAASESRFYPINLLNSACRSLPPLVRSTNSTSQRRSGFTQTHWRITSSVMA